jgi:hypothetical protein
MKPRTFPDGHLLSSRQLHRHDFGSSLCVALLQSFFFTMHCAAHAVWLVTGTVPAVNVTLSRLIVTFKRKFASFITPHSNGPRVKTEPIQRQSLTWLGHTAGGGTSTGTAVGWQRWTGNSTYRTPETTDKLGKFIYLCNGRTKRKPKIRSVQQDSFFQILYKAGPLRHRDKGEWWRIS